MAFKLDPVVVGLRPGTTPRSRVGLPNNPGTNGPARPSGHAAPAPAPAPEADDARCRAEYTEFREYTAKTQRRWRWIAAISGLAGLGIGVAVGSWQGGRSESRALPESE